MIRRTSRQRAIMKLSSRELWTALHGMIFGAGFLLAFAGVFFELWDLRADWLTDEGARHGARRLIAGAWTMAILAWLTVIVGTYAIYPWYRAKPPKGMTSSAPWHIQRRSAFETANSRLA